MRQPEDPQESPLHERKPIPLRWVLMAILIFALGYHLTWWLQNK
jgi:hypothetical protein